MRYNCVIVDDEPLAHDVLTGYISRIPDLQLEFQFYSSIEALPHLSLHQPDILFLDIDMPELSGVELLRQLPLKPVTIFVTAFLDYSLEGYDLGVLDYLVKPVRFERFQLAVNRAIQFLQLLQLQHQLEVSKDAESALWIKSGNKRMSVKRNAITHVQAMKDYAIVYANTEKYVVRSTMREMEELLGGNDFIRIHKSFIVAKNRMVNYNGNKIEFANFEIPVGRKYKAAVEKLLEEKR